MDECKVEYNKFMLKNNGNSSIEKPLNNGSINRPSGAQDIIPEGYTSKYTEGS